MRLLDRNGIDSKALGVALVHGPDDAGGFRAGQFSVLKICDRVEPLRE